MKRTLMKCATSVSAIALASLLSVSPIFAATHISVGDYEGDWTGEQSGTGWSWTNEGNDLNLDGYDGDAIEAQGDLTIYATGENTITTGDWQPYAIYSTGDVTINGGEITANTNGEGIVANDVTLENTKFNINADSKAFEGIRAQDGDINVENSEINIEYVYKFGLEGNNVFIDNSKINIETGMDDGIRATSVSIIDSDVDINGGPNDTWYRVACGIRVQGDFNNNQPGSIYIEGSNVKLYGIMGPILVDPLYNETGNIPGTITLDQCEIVSPENAEISNSEWGATYVTAKDADGNYISFNTIVIQSTKKEDTKKEETPAVQNRKSSEQTAKSVVNTGMNTDMSIYIAGAIVASAGMAILTNKKKK